MLDKPLPDRVAVKVAFLSPFGVDSGKVNHNHHAFVHAPTQIEGASWFIKEFLERHPFEPFRIRLSGGDAYDVRNSHSVALMKNPLFLALPTDRSVLVPYLHIAAIESVQAA